MHLETRQVEEKIDNIVDFELQLVLSTIKKCCGHDFEGYSSKSMLRLVEGIMHDEKLSHLSDLISKILYDRNFQGKVIDKLTISYSKLFRDTQLFLKLKNEIFPIFTSYPRISIWVAGCATGEEAYSLAILLDEAGLLNKTQIYASDISTQALKTGSSGKLKFRYTDADEKRFKDSGGTKSLSDYFNNENILDERILSHILFERHDLTTQSAFISAQLVLCRNVFIYFDRELQEKVLLQLLNSVSNRGYLAVGVEENISFCQSALALELVSRKAGLYKKLPVGLR